MGVEVVVLESPTKKELAHSLSGTRWHLLHLSAHHHSEAPANELRLADGSLEAGNLVSEASSSPPILVTMSCHSDETGSLPFARALAATGLPVVAVAAPPHGAPTDELVGRVYAELLDGRTLGEALEVAVPKTLRSAGVVTYVTAPLGVRLVRPEVPAYHRMLPPRSRRLFGRSTLLHEAMTALTSQPPNAVLLHGLGGVGKTSLAVELAHRLRRRTTDAPDPIVYWRAPSAPRELTPAVVVLLRMLANIAGSEEALPTTSRSPLDLEAHMTALRGTGVIIVLDDIDEARAQPLANEVLRYLGVPGRCRVIVTARTVGAGVSEHVSDLHVPPLSDSDARALVRAVEAETGKRAPREATELLVRAAAGRPGLLELGAYVLAQPELAFGVAKLNQHMVDEPRWLAKLVAHLRPRTARALTILASLAPEDRTRDFANRISSLAATAEGAGTLDEAVCELAGLGLIRLQRTSSWIARIHPAVESAVRSVTSPASQRQIVEAAASLFAAEANDETAPTAQRAEAWYRLATYAMRIGEYVAAAALLEQTVLHDDSTGPTRLLPLVEELLLRLGDGDRPPLLLLRALLHQRQGHFARAETDLREAYALVPPGEARARVANRLISLLVQLGRHEEAESLVPGDIGRPLDGLVRRMELMAGRSDYEGVLALGKKALQLASETETSWSKKRWNGREFVFGMLRTASIMTGRSDDAAGFAARQLESMSRRGASDAELARAEYMRYPVVLQLEGPAAAIELLEPCLEVFATVRDVSGMAAVRSGLAHAYAGRGDHERAIELSRHALRDYAQIGNRRQRGVEHFNLASHLTLGVGFSREALRHRLMGLTLQPALDRWVVLAQLSGEGEEWEDLLRTTKEALLSDPSFGADEASLNEVVETVTTDFANLGGRILVGQSDFVRIRQGRHVYIDKTDFIREFWEDGALVPLIIRPRRFGKTLNLDTLRAYFEFGGDAEMAHFEGTRIARWAEFDDHFKRYPVISLSFAEVSPTTAQECIEQVSALVADEVERHRSVLEDNLSDREQRRFEQLSGRTAPRGDVETSIRWLCQQLSKALGRRALVLIDEYDTPIQHSVEGGFYGEVIPFLSRLFRTALKGNSDLERGVLTGILRVAKESIFSGLNNVSVYSPLSREYATCFGFTAEEVSRLAAVRGFHSDLGTLERWYDGHRFGGRPMYNPWSIMRFANAPEDGPKPYWVRSARADAMIRKVLIDGDRAGIQAHMEALLRGEHVDGPVEENVTLSELSGASTTTALSFLLLSGYLSAEPINDESGRYRYTIPNLEVAGAFRDLYRDHLTRIAGGAPQIDAFVRAMIAADADDAERQLEAVVARVLSSHDVAGETEAPFHTFVLGLLVWLEDRFEVQSNRESGHGRFDVMMRPRRPQTDPAIIIEFKVVRDTARVAGALDEAEKQMRDRDYAATLRGAGIPRVTGYAIVAHRKRVRVRLVADL